MLPVINLDDQYFDDIIEEVRKMIPVVYPKWTDYNAHDPGITFLELFSWLKESQQFHMNQIGNDHYLMYLKLLGMQPAKRKPAYALVNCDNVPYSFALSKGSRIYAGDICFESVHKENISNIRIEGCEIISSDSKIKVGKEIISSGSNMRLPMFGEEAAVGAEFVMYFDKAFEADISYSIYFKLSQEYPVERNPIDEDSFIPLAAVKLIYYSEDGWQQAEIIRDETHAMIQSGKLYFKLPAPMFENEGSFKLKLMLKECNYEIAPMLNNLSLNVINVVQTESLSEYEDIKLNRIEAVENLLSLDSYLALHGEQDIFVKTDKGYVICTDIVKEKKDGKVTLALDNLFESFQTDILTLRIVNYSEKFSHRRCYDTNGLPYQFIELDDYEILPDSLELMVEDELNPGCFIPWEQVDSFYCSGADDCHYCYDDDKGRIIFGDCEYGKAPEGRLIIIGYKRTGGEGGNVKSMQINRPKEVPEGVSFYNKEDAYKGCEKESIEDCFRRFIVESRGVHRAITNEDYETLIKNTPGLMIANAKVIPITELSERDVKLDELTVTAVVQPYGGRKKKALNKAYLDNIHRYMADKKLIGAGLNILSPDYIDISVLLEVAVKPQYINAYNMVSSAVTDYFDNICNDFGKPVLYSDLYGKLDVLECVKQVQSLTISTQGRRIKRSMYGDLLMPVNGLAYLAELKITVISVN